MQKKSMPKIALAIAMALAAAGCARNDAAPSPSAPEASAEEASAAPALTQESAPELEAVAEASSEPEAGAVAEEAPVAGGTESQQASWRGVYVCHEGVGDGWVYLIEGENESSVFGTKIITIESGAERSFAIGWPISSEDRTVATESFQEGVRDTVHSLQGDRIVSDFARYGSLVFDRVGDYEEYPSYLDNASAGGADAADAGQGQSGVPAREPFWGIWSSASHDQGEMEAVASDLRARGFDAQVFETTDWSNLNPVHWYAVSVGVYPDEAAAHSELARVQAEVDSSAYVKYSGDWQGE